jgi:hypothetical protein
LSWMATENSAIVLYACVGSMFVLRLNFDRINLGTHSDMGTVSCAADSGVLAKEAGRP